MSFLFFYSYFLGIVNDIKLYAEDDSSDDVFNAHQNGIMILEHWYSSVLDVFYLDVAVCY